MAMTGGTAKLVKTGTPSGWNTPIKLYVYYKEKSRSITNNTTTLSLGMYVTTPGTAYDIGPWNDFNGSYIGTATSGSNCKSFDGTIPNFANTRWIVENKDITVTHNSDGTKSVTIYWKWGVNSPWGGFENPSGSFNVTLTTIPRESIIMATNANIGSQTTITIDRASSDFTHTLTYSFKGTSSTGVTGTIATKTTATTVKWTVPTSFYAKIPDAKSAKCTITCDTYNGSSKIGSNSTTFTATAAESQCSPTVSVAAEDTDTNVINITGNKSIIVKGYSKVKVTTTATAKNSASISSVSVACGSETKTGTNVTFTGAKSASIKSTAKDSRGYTKTVSASGLTFVDYIDPTITVTIERQSPTSNTVNVTAKGKWYNGNIGDTANTLTVEYRTKPASQSEYSDSANPYKSMTVTKSGNTYTATATLTDIDYNKNFSVRFRVSDKIRIYGGPIKTAVYKNTVIKKGIPVFDWGENDFKFHVPAELDSGYFAIGGEKTGIKVFATSITITPTAENSVTEVEVSFPEGMFTKTPAVVCTPSTGIPQSVHVGVSRTSSSAKVRLYRTNIAETGVSIIAIGV